MEGETLPALDAQHLLQILQHGRQLQREGDALVVEAGGGESGKGGLDRGRLRQDFRAGQERFRQLPGAVCDVLQVLQVAAPLVIPLRRLDQFFATLACTSRR